MKKMLAKLIASFVVLFSPLFVLAQATCSLNGQDVPCDSAAATAAGAAFGIGMLIFFIVFGIIALIAAAFWIWMIIHAATHEIENKALWIVLLIIFGILPAIIYYFVVKRKVDKQAPIVAPEAPKTV